MIESRKWLIIMNYAVKVVMISYSLLFMGLILDAVSNIEQNNTFAFVRSVILYACPIYSVLAFVLAISIRQGSLPQNDRREFSVKRSQAFVFFILTAVLIGGAFLMQMLGIED